jgi:hypothetical protein
MVCRLWFVVYGLLFVHAYLALTVSLFTLHFSLFLATKLQTINKNNFSLVSLKANIQACVVLHQILTLIK